MNGYIKHAFILSVILMSGCASYSMHELPPLQAWPLTADAAQQKPTTFVRATAFYQANGGEGRTVAGAPAALWESAIVDAFRESGRFSRVTTDKVDSDIYAEATLYNNEQYSVVSAVVTGLTMFIIPSTAKNTFTLETVFKDKDGKELGRIRKSESVRTWMQLVLIVALPFQQDTREVVQTLARSTLQEAVQRQLL
ncbi:hypothetical protein EQV97_24125 [Pseudomonas sp. TMW22090]|uniref:hypothetical protein n=1 Tax=Pseudomonas sp. TMW22090 TaxID=2506434 RepID=UPI001F1059B7|nr:hypothetical protein [Pseudomonas sp. TMW22090]MCH4880445.1 hypothetical protein [Pseudomonas sp. TMW22090]